MVKGGVLHACVKSVLNGKVLHPYSKENQLSKSHYFLTSVFCSMCIQDSGGHVGSTRHPVQARLCAPGLPTFAGT